MQRPGRRPRVSGWRSLRGRRYTAGLHVFSTSMVRLAIRSAAPHYGLFGRPSRGSDARDENPLPGHVVKPLLRPPCTIPGADPSRCSSFPADGCRASRSVTASLRIRTADRVGGNQQVGVPSLSMCQRVAAPGIRLLKRLAGRFADVAEAAVEIGDSSAAPVHHFRWYCDPVVRVSIGMVIQVPVLS